MRFCYLKGWLVFFVGSGCGDIGDGVRSCSGNGNVSDNGCGGFDNGKGGSGSE